MTAALVCIAMSESAVSVGRFHRPTSIHPSWAQRMWGATARAPCLRSARPVERDCRRDGGLPQGVRWAVDHTHGKEISRRRREGLPDGTLVDGRVGVVAKLLLVAKATVTVHF